MHRMNANRSNNDTSVALDDLAVQRIASSLKSKKTAIKKVASTTNRPIRSKVADKPEQVTIKIATINEIPNEFERIGTGFYRSGHHLWELTPGSDGFVLVRKRSEDHVLSIDPDPVSKTSVVDRCGNEIKIGSTVKLPHCGRIANAVVIVVQPDSVGMELEDGERISAPPDICELLPHIPGQEFEPDVEPSSKSADDENDDENEEDELEEKIAKTAQTHTQTQPLVAPTKAPVAPTKAPGPAPAKASTPPSTEFKRAPSRLLSKLDRDGFAVMQSPSNKSRFAAEKVGDQYKVYVVQEKLHPLFGPSSVDELIKWEAGIADLHVLDIGGNEIKAAMRLIDSSSMRTWNDYWYSVGQRIAARKPLTPEQKERRKQRRKERQLERKGLPPTTSLPPRKSAVVGEEVVELKERLRLYQQLIDEVEFVLQDESLRMDEARLADELERTITEHKEQLEEINARSVKEQEEALSIDTPPSEVEPSEKVAKVIVSMSDL